MSLVFLAKENLLKSGSFDSFSFPCSSTSPAGGTGERGSCEISAVLSVACDAPSYK